MELQLGRSHIRRRKAHRWVHRIELASHNLSNTGLDSAPRIGDRGDRLDGGHDHFERSPGAPFRVDRIRDAAHLLAAIQTRARDRLQTYSKRSSLI